MNSFFAPGRTELAGNHTDHQKGRVLASAVDKGIHAFVEPNFDNVARIRSAGFPDMDINLLDLDVHPEEFGSSAALVRGVASAMYDIGASFGGFDATLESELSAGSGLSSSAAFAVLMCRIFNGLYNNSELEPYAVARIAQQAENLHFGKPCGLMDQLACACGGVVAIDFNEALMPECESIKYDFARKGYSLIITDVREDHADLTGEYAAITEEMGQICAHFGVKRLCELEEKAFYASLHELHQAVPDRAILRGIHFYEENKRVQRGIQALKKDRLPDFFREVILSGESSWRLLQNLYKPGSIKQSLPLALAASELLLKEDGAWRVHGGGFGGTIMAFVPNAQRKIYIGQMNRLFGEGAAVELCVRPIGAVCLEM